MDYVSFGVGNKNLIIIPGLGDGLRTVKRYGLLHLHLCIDNLQKNIQCMCLAEEIIWQKDLQQEIWHKI